MLGCSIVNHMFDSLKDQSGFYQESGTQA
uniref:Uncharacterized protein n=1 Tax=Arundo donax TaxID=35708 RepID=A0A0A9DTD7_ARUDO